MANILFPSVNNDTRFQQILDTVDCWRTEATRKLAPECRSERGQFLTPMPIARLMASFFSCSGPNIRMLDAGAEVGALLTAATARFASQNPPPRSIHVTAYEIDPTLLTYLSQTIELCREQCQRRGILFTSELIGEDFLEQAAERLAHDLFAQKSRLDYTCAILNPPYRKINASSRHRTLLKRMGMETSNLYSGFVYAAIRLLAPDGQIVAITPRSFCNGPYFTTYRRFLLKNIALERIHLFSSRQEAFSDDAILQENVILSGTAARRISRTLSTLRWEPQPRVRFTSLTMLKLSIQTIPCLFFASSQSSRKKRLSSRWPLCLAVFQSWAFPFPQAASWISAPPTICALYQKRTRSPSLSSTFRSRESRLAEARRPQTKCFNPRRRLALTDRAQWLLCSRQATVFQRGAQTDSRRRP